MKVEIEISQEELDALKERQTFRMNWIMAGMDEVDTIDIVLQKVLDGINKAK